MPVAPSFDDLLAQYEAEALGIRPTLQFLEGDVTTAQQHGAGAMADAAIRFTVQALKETFLDGAKGAALTKLVNDHLNIQRAPATSSQVACTFTRAGGGAAGSMLTGYVVGSAFDLAGNTVLYTLDADVTFGAGDNGPHVQTATAQVVGRAGNVGVGKVTRMVGNVFSSLVTVTNASVAAGGNDEESDDELRVRARNFSQTLRKGTLGALEFGAQQVPSVRIARATEDIGGIVTLVVTDSDGGSTAQMVLDVVVELENWRSAGSLVNVVGGSALVVDVTGQLIALQGVDTSVLGPVAASAIAGRMLKLRQGETLYLDTIKAAGISVDPDALEALILSTPMVDVVPGPAQVIRPGVVTVT